MTTIFNLRAATQRDLSLDARSIADRGCLCGGLGRHSDAGAHHARRSRSPGLSMVTGASSGGVITFDPASNLCVFAAPESDMAGMTGTMAYDCRLELPGGECLPLFAGRIVWTPGA